jgi:hypothetical protein
MRASWLVLVVALYVSLDVANPLMPGAVTFGLEDPLAMRHAERARGHEEAVPIRAEPMAELQRPEHQAPPLAVAIADRAPAMSSPGRRARSSLFAPAAPSEDH